MRILNIGACRSPNTLKNRSSLTNSKVIQFQSMSYSLVTANKYINENLNDSLVD